MKRLSLIAVLTLILLGRGVIFAGAAWADPSDRVDVGGSALNPFLFLLLEDQARRDPDHTLFKLDDIGFQVLGSKSGSLARVAQYEPIDAGVKVHGLFFEKAFTKDLLSLRLDYDGSDSLNLDASLRRPYRYDLRFNETRVFHRLQHDPRDVDLDLTPGATYQKRWSRTDLRGDLSLTRNGEVGVYGGYSLQGRAGEEQHSFFQLHRFNCTDCHTFAASRSLSEHTEDFYGGVRARLPWEGTVLNAKFRRSDFNNGDTRQTFFFGGPFGVSQLFPTVSSHDTWQEYQLFAGEHRYRAGAHATFLDRQNTSSGQTLRNSYLSLQAAGYPLDNLALTAGYYAQSEQNSISTNLSNYRNRFYFQASLRPIRTVNVSARVGEDDRQYQIGGMAIPRADDTYYQIRGDYRPNYHLHASAGFRADNTNHPFLPTDLARQSVLDANLDYSQGMFDVGGRFTGTHGSNTVNALQQQELMFYGTAALKNGLALNTSYATSYLNASNAQSFFFNDPASIFGNHPVIGSPLFLQSGTSYRASSNEIMAGLTVPLFAGKKHQHPWIFSPTYRWVTTNSDNDYLQLFPEIPAASQTRIRQSILGLRFDIPVGRTGQRVGVGYSYDDWKDLVNPQFGGNFSTYSLYFTRRF